MWQFYHYRREVVLKAQPNAAHCSIARFSTRRPGDPNHKFTLITQNIDGLSPKALDDLVNEQGISLPTGRTKDELIIEMHGRLFDTICTQCDDTVFDPSSPLTEALASSAADWDKNKTELIIPISDLPKCRKCSGLTRPGVVWFGEVPKRLDEIDTLLREADLCLVVGTSSRVGTILAPRLVSH